MANKLKLVALEEYPNLTKGHSILAINDHIMVIYVTLITIHIKLNQLIYKKNMIINLNQ